MVSIARLLVSTRLTFFEADVFARAHLWPDSRHCLRLFQCRPILEEERHFDLYEHMLAGIFAGISARAHLADVFKGRGKAAKHLCGDIIRREFAADVLERAQFQRRQVELVREAVDRFGRDGSRAVRRGPQTAHTAVCRSRRRAIRQRPFGRLDPHVALGQPFVDPLATGLGPVVRVRRGGG